MGITLEHGLEEMAYAVMEGVSCLLRNNLEYCISAGYGFDRIISTGGGAKSAYWSQLKANICGKEIWTPNEKEAACRGAAVIGAVSAGIYSDFEDANRKCPLEIKAFKPSADLKYEERYKLYKVYMELLKPAFITYQMGVER